MQNMKSGMCLHGGCKLVIGMERKNAGDLKKQWLGTQSVAGNQSETIFRSSLEILIIGEAGEMMYSHSRMGCSEVLSR